MTASKLVLSAASGVGGAGLDVDEVFATRLWEGTSDTRTVTNDIDLSGEGGLVWIKKSSGTDNHQLFDTVRGATKTLVSNDTDAEATSSNGVTAFGSSGFNLGSDGGVNSNSSAYVGWTFRKAKKFFDIVQYSGDGTNGRTVNHNLGSVPGMILIKRTNSADDWRVFHRSLSNKYGGLNSTGVFGTDGGNVFGNPSNGTATAPTSTQFTVDGGDAAVNGNGSTYVAYLFAHNDGDGGFGPDGDADIIKCGSYTGAYPSGPVVNLGFEPQWIMFKNASSSSNWFIYDVQRGWRLGLGQDFSLAPDSNVGENAASGGAVAGFPTATGFDLKGAGLTAVNASGDTHIYVAIRKGSLNVPEDATKVFGLDTDATGGSSVVNFRPHLCDMAWFAKLDGNSRNVQIADRVRGFQKTNTNSDDAYTSPTVLTNPNDSEFTSSNAIHQTDTFQATFPVVRAVSSGGNFMLWSWKRAPSYFDIVGYDGTGSNRTVSHNLGVVPEMIWVKCRSNADNWAIYHKDVGATKHLLLNSDLAANTSSTRFNDTTPTSSVFTVGTDGEVNGSSRTYIAYLFATADGVSKVGSVSHSFNSETNVDCGFSSGAKFVLAKSISTGGWLIWDSVRGINAGTDPYLRLDTTDAQVTNGDFIEPHNAGFTFSTGFSTDTYIFYAVA